MYMCSPVCDRKNPIFGASGALLCDRHTEIPENWCMSVYSIETENMPFATAF